nr:MAG TPA: hypothetical protein [Caudoviricetes sp.]
MIYSSLLFVQKKNKKEKPLLSRIGLYVFSLIKGIVNPARLSLKYKYSPKLRISSQKPQNYDLWPNGQIFSRFYIYLKIFNL